MAVPLIQGAEELARMAATMTPRFSAVLSTASQQREPISIESKFVKPEPHSLVMHVGQVAKWAQSASRTALLTAVTGLGAHQAVAGQPDEPALAPGRHPAIQAVYDKVIGDKPMNALRAIEQQKDVQQVASADRKAVENTPSRQDYEATLLTASIVGIGFGNKVDRVADKGAFDAHVYGQVKAAAGVIAPGKLLSAMTDVERGAVATAVIQASQGAFLKQMRIQEPGLFRNGSDLSKKIVEVSANLPKADQIAKGFMKDGKFSEEVFNAKTTEGEGMTPAQAIAHPKNMQAVLMNASMQKAADSIVATHFDVIDKDVSSQSPLEQWSLKTARTIRMGVEDRDKLMERPETDEERMNASTRPRAM